MKQLKLGTIHYLFFSKDKLEQMSAVKLYSSCSISAKRNLEELTDPESYMHGKIWYRRYREVFSNPVHILGMPVFCVLRLI